MPLRYSVETCIDNPASLQVRLDEVTEANGRVLSVIWQPQREVPSVDFPEARFTTDSGYVIVVEYFEAQGQDR
jgi:hypothetical protein